MFEPRGFCFDLDETLVDAEAQHVHATRAMLDSLGFPPTAARDVFHGSTTTGARTSDLVDAIRLHLRAPQSLDELVALRHSAFLAALDDDPPLPMPGATALVEACAALGPVAVVSSGHRDDILASLRAIGLLGRVSVLVTGEDVVEPKPAPEAYKVAASRFGLIADDLLVFEDSARGVRSALDAGCRVVAVPNARSTLPEAVSDAHLVLASLEDALPLDALLVRLR